MTSLIASNRSTKTSTLTLANVCVAIVAATLSACGGGASGDSAVNPNAPSTVAIPAPGNLVDNATHTLPVVDALQGFDLAIDGPRLLLLDLDARLIGEEGQQQDREDHEEQNEDRRETNGRRPPQLGDLTHGSCIQRHARFANMPGCRDQPLFSGAGG